MSRTINCDQVAWMLNAIDRHLPAVSHPRVSRAREMQTYALLYELMEVADLRFEDAAAQHNATPPDVFRLVRKNSNPEQGSAQQAQGCIVGSMHESR